MMHASIENPMQIKFSVVRKMIQGKKYRGGVVPYELIFAQGSFTVLSSGEYERIQTRLRAVAGSIFDAIHQVNMINLAKCIAQFYTTKMFVEEAKNKEFKTELDQMKALLRQYREIIVANVRSENIEIAKAWMGKVLSELKKAELPFHRHEDLKALLDIFEPTSLESAHAAVASSGLAAPTPPSGDAGAGAARSFS